MTFLYPLFEHMSVEHGLTLTESELNDIRDICQKLGPHPPTPVISKRQRSAVCPGCGKRVQICIPVGGDGSVDVYYRHYLPTGGRCTFSRAEVTL